METQYPRSNTLKYIHGAFLGIALTASFASGLLLGINRTEKRYVSAIAEAYAKGAGEGVSLGLKTDRPNSATLEKRSLDGRKWYLIDLEGKVQPGNYELVTEESDVCGILSNNVQVRSGNYKLMLIEQNKEKISAPVISAPLPNPIRTEEKGNELPYAIPGTNKLDLINAKKFGLPSEGYIVKPHPYKERSFIIIKDTDSEKFEEPYKTSLKIVNPDGSIHYNVQVRDVKGNLLREYIEPSNDRLEKNPNSKPESDKPIFHSTTPIFTYPDGKIEAYNPLREGETLEDVMKKGPVETFVPEKESSK